MSFWSLIYRTCAHFGLSTPRELRYWWLMIFRQSYVAQKHLHRKGKCLHCGKCCTYCPWLIKKNNKFYCKDYKNRPFFCQFFPFDEKDKAMVNKDCGFYWGNKHQLGLKRMTKPVSSEEVVKHAFG